MTVTDFDPETLPKFLRRGPPGLRPVSPPEAAPRAVAVEPPAVGPQKPKFGCANYYGCDDPRICEAFSKCVFKDAAPDPQINRLDEIASLVRSLTYGEMIELAEALWNLRPAGQQITQSDLPGMLHKWSTNRG